MKEYRKLKLIICTFFLSTQLLLNSSNAQDIEVTSVEKTKWKNDANGAYTIIHDDFCDGGTTGIHEYAIPEANDRGLVLGFGAIVGECINNSYWKIVKDAVKVGHEIINHSYTHPSLPGLGGSELEYEIVESKDRLETEIQEEISNYHVSFFIFPYDEFNDGTIQMLEDNGYIGARTGSKQNLAHPSASFEPLWYGINFDVYDEWGGTQAYSLNDFADAAISNDAWAVRELHGVADASWHPVPLQDYKDHLDHLKEKVDAGELWVGTPSNVIRYTKTYYTCGEPTASGNTISFPSGGSVDEKYATAISLIVEVAESPELLEAEQGQEKCNVEEWGNNTYLVDANPKKGDVILTAGNVNGPFSLTVNVEGGTVTKNPDLDEYEKGTQVELTAIPENNDIVFIEWTGDINSTDNPLTITMNEDITVTAVFKDMSELIVNGNFDNGTEDWSLYVEEGEAEASGEVVNGEYKLNVTKTGTESWHIQLSQSGIHLIKDREYKLTFSACASTSNATLQLGIYNAVGDTDYMTGQFSLTEEMQDFTKEFIMTKETDEYASLFIDMGTSDFSLTFDNVSIKIRPVTGIPYSSNSITSRVKNRHTFLHNSSLFLSIKHTDQISIAVTDITGRTIKSIKDKTYSNGIHNISSLMNNLGNGIYILNISDNRGKTYSKINWVK